MLAKRVEELPEGEEWIFEPKWDGFRALIFRDGDEVMIQSRDTKPLNRYFPELMELVLTKLPERCVLDGEIVIASPTGLDFEGLQLRIHPAASRVKTLAKEIPASIVFFDLLALGDDDLTQQPFEKRRAEYEAKANETLSAAEQRKASLEGAEVTIKANSSTAGKLFGSVGPRDIADAFSAAGKPLNKSEVVMGEGPIRHTGEFDVQIHLHADVHTTVKVIVAAED